MIIDTSALVAILRNEGDANIYKAALQNAGPKYMAGPTYLEFCMVMIGQKGKEVKSELDQFLNELQINLRNFDENAAQVAVDAFLRYGKGRGHKAQLNFGDCISYAMSKTELMPLLFKGDDFRLTDVDCAI